MASEAVSFFGLNVPIWGALPTVFAAVLTVVMSKKMTQKYFNFLNKEPAPGRSPHDGFGGPIGAFVIMHFLPVFIYTLYFVCNADQVVSLNPLSPKFLKFTVNPLAGGFAAFFERAFSLKITLIFAGWVLLHWLLYLVVPGPVVEGTPLKNAQGTRLLYRLNATRCGVTALAIVLALVYIGVLPATFVYDNFLQLITASALFSISMSLALYAWSRLTCPPNAPGYNPGDAVPLHQLSHTGNSGWSVYDLWMGRTLNPRLGFLDLKFVCELRPGLLLWAVMNFSFAAKQFEKFGAVTPSMALVCLFHIFYVFDSYVHERAILTTMDITTDGFGYMLCFGDLTWVPFTYTLQARYLADHPVALPWYFLVAIVALKAVGFWIFRGSNSQKNLFRTNPAHPDVAHLKVIETKIGRKLLADGWWGKSRHINYMGDLMMGLAWCLTTGFNTPITYFYVIYFSSLLFGRQLRDDQKCKEQYGADWDRYCALVPYRIVPYVY
jgi:protein-S-isoprenylcysteine O-methyltransferase Ste14